MITPPLDCSLCPRLCAFRGLNRLTYPAFFNAPVPSFGDLGAKLLVVGLAPGLKGANQTGRPFTGDYAGVILYNSLLKHGLAKGEYAARANDNFSLLNCRVTNAVRCVPPENKPEIAEINNCNQFLRGEINAMPNLLVILSLGQVSHNAVLAALGLKSGYAKFKHGAVHTICQPQSTVYLLNSYHTSRYNMNTGRLTVEMFDEVVKICASLLSKTSA
jgi:uracil-DNA glycosylase family 4